jgi:superfamily II DNA or RNA helicase
MKNKKREEIQKEASSKIKECKFQGIVLVSPRVGKCKIAIDALNTIKKTELRILVIAPKVPILKEWETEVVKWNLNSNISVDYCWSNSLKKNKKKYDLIIADECHAYNLKVLAQLRGKQIQGSRILGLTGTLDQKAEFDIGNILSIYPIYTYSIEQAIKDGIVADYEIICVGCELDDTNKTIEAGNEETRFYQTEKEAYTYWNNRYNRDKELMRYKNLRFLSSKRMDIIYRSQTKLDKTKEIIDQYKRCLIFSGRQEIADQLGDGSFHSKSNKENLMLFKDKKINKLSVIGMISMGVTIPKLKVAIFNQLKSVEALACQQAMRTMNLEGSKKATVIIVYLKDTQDEIWLQSAVQGFEKSKIKYI